MQDVLDAEDWARARADEMIDDAPVGGAATLSGHRPDVTVIGIVLFALGLLFSIAWHELGHLTFAKLYNVRVTQYMVGFGKTVWSEQVGETEYGLKAIPLGGYIRMIGMVPPGKDGRQKITTTAADLLGMVRQIIEDSRAGDRAQVTAADDGRQFYQLHPFKRIVVMVAGPVHEPDPRGRHLRRSLMVGIGVPTAEHHRGQRQRTASSRPPPAARRNRPTAPRATADPGGAGRAAARRHDRRLRRHPGRPAGTSCTDADPRHPRADGRSSTIVRDGQPMTTVGPDRAEPSGRSYDDQGNQTGTTVVGFLGVSPPGAVRVSRVDRLGLRPHRRSSSAPRRTAVVGIPARIPALWNSIFNDAPRDLQLAGRHRRRGPDRRRDPGLGHRAPGTSSCCSCNLLAGFNMSLFLLNMLPLLPLDGGHILGAIDRMGAQAAGRSCGDKSDPGPFDVAKLMPVAYVVALLFIGLTVLTARRRHRQPGQAVRLMPADRHRRHPTSRTAAST